MSRLPILVAGLVSFEVAPIIHPVVEHANNKDARLVGFEEDAVTATGGHLQARVGRSRPRHQYRYDLGPVEGENPLNTNLYAPEPPLFRSAPSTSA